ncbi:MAG TPA: response regulator [Thermoanaerobaculia bacterium]|jgi:CheY-like chemotaxis protein|nr:response regulator [Thermoanaerobaculia bacterium]
MQILLVDDDVPSVEAMKELLEGAGYGVVCAENGRDALARLRGPDSYCVILLDLMMPVMNGYEFREEQLKDPKLAAIPVVVITADGRAREKAEQIGTERYVQKPLSPAELLRTIEEYCPAPTEAASTSEAVGTSEPSR